MKRMMIVLLACVFSVAVVAPVLASEEAAQTKDASTPPEVKKELVKLKFVTGNDILPLIQTFLDLRYERINMDSSKKILTLSATPENIEKMKQVIREVDVKPADLLFTVQLVLGSEAGGEGTDPIQSDPLIKELRGLLRYKSYTLLDSSMVRVVNREWASIVLGKKAEFEFQLRPVVAGDAKTPIIKTELMLKQTVRAGTPETDTMKAVQPVVNTPIMSTLNIKSGERTVVGVSKLDGGDKGLILIISGKIID